MWHVTSCCSVGNLLDLGLWFFHTVGSAVDWPLENGPRWILSHSFPFLLTTVYYIKINTRDAAAAAAKSLQSCPTLCDARDGSPPGSPIPGILQARTLEWVAISFSSAWKWKMKVKSLSHVQLLATAWTAAHQAPPSMGFSRQEDWSGVPLQQWAIRKWNLVFCYVSWGIKCMFSKTHFIIW